MGWKGLQRAALAWLSMRYQRTSVESTQPKSRKQDNSLKIRALDLYLRSHVQPKDFPPVIKRRKGSRKNCVGEMKKKEEEDEKINK